MHFYCKTTNSALCTIFLLHRVYTFGSPTTMNANPPSFDIWIAVCYFIAELFTHSFRSLIYSTAQNTHSFPAYTLVRLDPTFFPQSNLSVSVRIFPGRFLSVLSPGRPLPQPLPVWLHPLTWRPTWHQGKVTWQEVVPQQWRWRDGGTGRSGWAPLISGLKGDLFVVYSH